MPIYSSARGGISFSGALTITFIALKLTNFIDWPWIWVLCPTWIWFALGALLVTLGIVVEVFESRRFKKKIAKIKEQRQYRTTKSYDKL